MAAAVASAGLSVIGKLASSPVQPSHLNVVPLAIHKASHLATNPLASLININLVPVTTRKAPQVLKSLPGGIPCHQGGARITICKAKMATQGLLRALQLLRTHLIGYPLLMNKSL